MNIFTAPLAALYNLDLYRKAVRSSLSKGFLYLVYLSAIASLLMTLFFGVRVMPELNKFTDWVKRDMPVLVWTPDGLTMKAASPYVMQYPAFGLSITFDMTKAEVTADEIKDQEIFVTSKKIYVRRNGHNELRVYDLTEPPDPKAKPLQPVTVDASTVEKMRKMILPWLIISVPLLTFPFFFVWKLVAALLLSLVGVLFNLTRRPPLPYSAVLNATFFAMTAATLIQWLQLFLPRSLPLGILGSLILTSIYLFIAVKKTDGDEVEPQSEI